MTKTPNTAWEKELLEFALLAGATDAALLRPEKVLVDEYLAAFCHDPKCAFWGASISCPPHVTGPSGFRKLLEKSASVLVVRFDVQSCSLLGEERPQVMRILHELVATVELQAKQLGFPDAAGFAGGSCKACFCRDEADCSAIPKDGKCRYPRQARPSLSGYGVNVGKLLESAGWPGTLFDSTDGMSWVVGLVLL